jgi:hypothetical protein
MFFVVYAKHAVSQRVGLEQTLQRARRWSFFDDQVRNTASLQILHGLALSSGLGRAGSLS